MMQRATLSTAPLPSVSACPVVVSRKLPFLLPSIVTSFGSVSSALLVSEPCKSRVRFRNCKSGCSNQANGARGIERVGVIALVADEEAETAIQTQQLRRRQREPPQRGLTHTSGEICESQMCLCLQLASSARLGRR